MLLAGRLRRERVLETHLFSSALLSSVLVSIGALGCGSDVESGTRVELISTPAALAVGQELTTTSGAVVRVDDLHWTSAEIELLGCPDAWQRVKRFMIPEAYAHGTASPTLMASPTIESAHSAVDLQLAELSPPAGRYCMVRYRLAPADRDAAGLDSAPSMLGSSFDLRGSVGANATQLADFEIVSTQSLDLAFDIELELSAEHRVATLRFEHEPSRWFEGLDLSTLTGAARERAVLESFRSAITLRVQ